MPLDWRIAVVLVVGGCSWDWNAFDPRLAEGATASSGAGGGGGAASSSATATASTAATVGTGGAGADYRQTVLSDGPVAYWRFGEAPSSTMALDETAPGYMGTYQGGVTLGVTGALAGDPNSAARFDGVDDQVDFGDVLDFTGLVPYSVEVWVLPDVVQPSGHRIICAKQLGATDGLDFGLDPATQTLYFAREVGVAGEGATGMVPFGQFSHVVGTFDGTSLRAYLNAVELSVVAAQLAFPDSPAPWVVGNSYNVAEQLSGVIDELAVYDKALSPARIAAHYAAGTGQ